MSRHTAYRFNLTHKAILATVMGFGTLNAQAISLGQPAIQSEQHEPLSATITVSNIDANQFEASIASSSVYAQMGLSHTAGIQARFIRTSDTSGKILLTSSEPISTPFADIVLNLSNKGEQVIEPQTLLMPLPKEGNIANALVTADTEQNLPVVSTLPVVVQDMSVSDDSEYSEYHVATQPEIEPPLSTHNRVVPFAPIVTDQNKEVLSSITPEGANTQLQVLTEQITRKIYPAGLAPKYSNEELRNNTPFEKPATPFETAQTKKPTPPMAKNNLNASAGGNDNTGASYVVQSGDNLWSIANQIAKANNMSVEEVMRALHKQNPDAFHNGKMSQLKANATLSIPNYEVIPSQKAIQEAISARRHTAPTQTKPSRTSYTKAVSANANNSRPRTVAKPLPKPQVTLVTPSQSGEATGGQVRTETKSNGDQLVGTLKDTRNQTAQTARRVNGLNQELSSVTQKLQIQNQKLAELEARLKALKENK